MPAIGRERQRGVTCKDCYFRQELLCALKGERVCPTFRATVGRAPAAPAQAQLIPVPQPTHERLVAQVPQPGIADDGAVRALTAAAAAPPVMTAPFAAGAPESTFTVRETLDVAGVRHDVDVVHAVPRAAAHDRTTGDSLVVSLGDSDLQDRLVDVTPLPVVSTSEYRTRSRGVEGHRAGRIAQRIAQRYPQSQLC